MIDQQEQLLGGGGGASPSSSSGKSSRHQSDRGETEQQNAALLASASAALNLSEAVSAAATTPPPPLPPPAHQRRHHLYHHQYHHYPEPPSPPPLLLRPVAFLHHPPGSVHRIIHQQQRLSGIVAAAAAAAGDQESTAAMQQQHHHHHRLWQTYVPAAGPFSSPESHELGLWRNHHHRQFIQHHMYLQEQQQRYLFKEQQQQQQQPQARLLLEDGANRLLTRTRGGDLGYQPYYQLHQQQQQQQELQPLFCHNCYMQAGSCGCKTNVVPLRRLNGSTASAMDEDKFRALISEKVGHHKKSAYRNAQDGGCYSPGPAYDGSIISEEYRSLWQQPIYTTLDDVKGQIYLLAKDQHGCRFLQRKFEEGSKEDAECIFMEIIDQVADLMMDPFGNYLVQKILDNCDDLQRMRILKTVTVKSLLVTISLSTHGTRAVQKLIETLKTPEEVTMVLSSLKSGVLLLIKDSNGNHVIQRCLLNLSSEDNQFIFDAVVKNCVDIATHRHGCCVLQRCIDSTTAAQHNRLIMEIAANALVLSQDPFGNYVVQYILDLGYSWASLQVISRMAGNFPQLAMQKFSSNVVERCLKLADEEPRNVIIQELITFPSFSQLLHHEYANYVIQSALSIAKGHIHTSLIDTIRPHLAALRSSPYGKRILSRTNLKKNT